MPPFYARADYVGFRGRGLVLGWVSEDSVFSLLPSSVRRNLARGLAGMVFLALDARHRQILCWFSPLPPPCARAGPARAAESFTANDDQRSELVAVRPGTTEPRNGRAPCPGADHPPFLNPSVGSRPGADAVDSGDDPAPSGRSDGGEGARGRYPGVGASCRGRAVGIGARGNILQFYFSYFLFSIPLSVDGDTLGKSKVAAVSLTDLHPPVRVTSDRSRGGCLSSTPVPSCERHPRPS